MSRDAIQHPSCVKGIVASMWQLIIMAAVATLFGGAAIMFLGTSENPLAPELMKLRYQLVGGAALLISLMAGLRMRGQTAGGKRVMGLWIGFAVSMIVSGIVNREMAAVRDGIWYLFGVPAVCFVFLPSLLGRNAGWITAWALILGNLPFLALSIIREPLGGSLYQGIFANSNQMGVTCTITSAGATALLLGAMSTRKSFVVIAGWSSVMVGLLALLLASSSRTSLITWAVVMVVFGRKAFRYTRALSQAVAVAVVLIGIGAFTQRDQLVETYYGIVDTYNSKSDVGGFNGREEIWSQTWEDRSLFGYGYDYFTSRFELGGHNTTIDLIGRLGLINAGFAICVCVATLWEAMCYARINDEDSYATLPLLVIICFWTLGLGEGMFGSLGNAVTMAFLVSTGIITSAQVDPLKKSTQSSRWEVTPIPENNRERRMTRRVGGVR